MPSQTLTCKVRKTLVSMNRSAKVALMRACAGREAQSASERMRASFFIVGLDRYITTLSARASRAWSSFYPPALQWSRESETRLAEISDACERRKSFRKNGSPFCARVWDTICHGRRLPRLRRASVLFLILNFSSLLTRSRWRFPTFSQPTC